MRKDVFGFENYEFDAKLNVYNKKTGRQLKRGLDKDGYEVIRLTDNKKSYLLKVHRLIALTFIENPNNKPEVNHKNSIRNDNRIENLEWATRAENNRHSWVIGNQCNKGENHPQNKLTNEIVKDIFYLRNTSKWKQQKIADKFEIDQTTVSDILRRKTWSHVEIKKP